MVKFGLFLNLKLLYQALHSFQAIFNLCLNLIIRENLIHNSEVSLAIHDLHCEFVT